MPLLGQAPSADDPADELDAAGVEGGATVPGPEPYARCALPKTRLVRRRGPEDVGEQAVAAVHVVLQFVAVRSAQRRVELHILGGVHRVFAHLGNRGDVLWETERQLAYRLRAGLIAIQLLPGAAVIGTIGRLRDACV